MKYIITLLFLFLSLGLFSPSYAQSSLRDQVQAMQGGEQLLEKIHIGTEKLIVKIQDDASFEGKLRIKLKEVQALYKQKKDQKSQDIIIILQYLESQIDGKLKVASSRVLQRLEKIKAEKYKKVSTTRVNKLKKKKYERISIKK